MNLPTTFHNHFLSTVIPAMQKRFLYRNALMVPRLKKIVLSIGIGRLSREGKSYDWLINDIALITGQHPIVTKARKAIANFKIRLGVAVGLQVTLRGKRMENFFDRFIRTALPRVRDFRGISEKSINRGTITIGLKEHTVFPEVKFESSERVYGFEVTIVTTARTAEETKEFLSLLGVPFQKRTK